MSYFERSFILQIQSVLFIQYGFLLSLNRQFIKVESQQLSKESRLLIYYGSKFLNIALGNESVTLQEGHWSVTECSVN